LRIQRRKLNEGRLTTMKNPKSHDALFKWLIATFIVEFFEHYFPDVNVKIGKDPFLDKEFISKYEALKASLEGDIFLIVEVNIKWSSEGEIKGKIEVKLKVKLKAKSKLLRNSIVKKF